MVVLGLALSFMDRPAQAITLTWDSSGLASSGTTIVDGSGTWDTATPEWWNSSSSANQAWNNSDVPSDTAVFGVGSPASNPYTVTLNTGITVGGITFANQAYTISGNTLSLSPPSGSTTTIAVNSGLVGTINSAVSDGGSGFGLSKTGAGTLVMNGPAT
jgi:hypothetical protein